MKKSIIKICVTTVLLILMLIQLNLNTVYAFGFADYDDATADAEQNKELKEQEQIVKENINKSSNNYLSELSVEGYEITPKFDKQTVDYQIRDSVTVDELKINAKLDDNRATISGDGTVKLQSGENNLRIDVKAENGMTRTYNIKATKKVSEDLKIKSLKLLAVDQNNNTYDQELSPYFDGDTFLYTCNVYDNINSIKVEAIPSLENADIEIEGNENLKEGLNTITVTAKSGDKETTYKIQVTKQQLRQLENIESGNLDKNKIIAIAGIAILVIAAIMVIAKKGNKHSTRNSKH